MEEEKPGGSSRLRPCWLQLVQEELGQERADSTPCAPAAGSPSKGPLQELVCSRDEAAALCDPHTGSLLA